MAEHKAEQSEGVAAIPAASGDPGDRRLELTASAVRRIATLLEDEPKDGMMLRVSVAGGGCSGFQYAFEIETAKADDDLVIEKNGVRVLVDPVSVDFLKGARIDFVDDLIGQSFKIDNPNVSASCGCGVSFSI